MVSIYIYEEIYETINIYKDSSVEFICWVCPKLSNVHFKTDDIIYTEGDRVRKLYSIQRGDISFVLPEYNFCPYININSGDTFGYSDLCNKETGQVAKDWYYTKEKLIRKFTTRCLDNCSVFEMDIDTLIDMNTHYTDDYLFIINKIPGVYKKI